MLKQIKQYTGLFYLSKRQVTEQTNVIPCAFLPNHASGLQKYVFCEVCKKLKTKHVLKTELMLLFIFN